MTARPPLPWETKAVIGCLLLMSLQQIHEVVLFYLKINTGLAHLQLLSPLLLTVSLSCALGLYRRNRKAWWWTVLFMGALGLLHLAIFWSPVERSLEPPPQQRFMNAEYEWLRPFRFSPFGTFWVISRGVMLLLAPTLLLLGELRKALRSS